VQDFRKVKGERVLSVVIYVTMGWLAVLAIGPLARALGTAGFVGLLAGGVFYTGGIIFYALDRRQPVFHGIWHLFVLAGSVAHYVVVLTYAT
jgi:hemolysin III